MGPVWNPKDAPLRAGPSAARLLERRLVQPDARSCGACVLVVARLLADESYAALLETGRHPRTGRLLGGDVLDRFRDEVLAMHRRVTGPVDVRGRAQLPWPRALGTPPWAVARQLPGDHRVRPVLPGRRAESLIAIRAALETGGTVPLYVGQPSCPRHVVLVVSGDEAGLLAHDPARGKVVHVTTAEFVGGQLRATGWPTPWFTVLPG